MEDNRNNPSKDSRTVAKENEVNGSDSQPSNTVFLNISSPTKKAPPVLNGGGASAKPNLSEVSEEEEDEEYEYEYEEYDEDEDDDDDEVLPPLTKDIHHSSVQNNQKISPKVDEPDQVDFDEEDEEVEIEEVEVDEEEEIEVEDGDDDEEYNRIANKIDELISKTNSLQRESSTGNTADDKVIESGTSAAVNSSEQVVQPRGGDSKCAEMDDYHRAAIHRPSNEDSDKFIYQLNDGSQTNLAFMKQHASNKWNISDLNDEEDSLNYSSTGKNLGDSDDNESEPEQKRRFLTCPQEPQNLFFSLDDDEEVSEIEIALEDGNCIIEEVEEEEDDDDQVDDQMPDNLLQNANDQLDHFHIDIPLTPSPTPSQASSPGIIKRPISPSSLILSKVRNLVIMGQLKPLEALLESAPNFFIDAILKAGWTALMYASYRGYPAIVRFCLERGADPNYHKECFTSLMAVCSSVNSDECELVQCMRLLLEHGARINAVDKFGCVPLHYAARFGRSQLIECLVQNGASVNHANDNGWSALHYAAAENHGEAVATLLEMNADVRSVNRDGLTAAQVAALRNNQQIAEALKQVENDEYEEETVSVGDERSGQQTASNFPLTSSPSKELTQDKLTQSVNSIVKNAFEQATATLQQDIFKPLDSVPLVTEELDDYDKRVDESRNENIEENDIVPEFRSTVEMVDLSKKYSIDLSNYPRTDTQQQEEPLLNRVLVHIIITCVVFMLLKYIFNALFG